MKAILSIALTIISITLLAQEERPTKIEQDGINVTYEFSELKGKRAEEGPQELCIFIKNNNEHNVNVKFSLAFFEDGFVNEESAVLDLCIAPGKIAKGKKLALCWLITEENDKKIKEDAFDWNLNDLSVEKVESCK